MTRNALGIMQGRLLDPLNSSDLDWFPINNWEDEFSLAQQLGFQTIELVFDRKKDKRNPLYSYEGRKRLKKKFTENKLIPYSSCINYIIDYPLSDADIFEDVKESISYLKEIGINNVILPLFDRSSIEKNNMIPCIKKLVDIAEKKNMLILIETDKSGEDVSKYLSNIMSKNLGLVYDIGNASYFGHDIARDLDLLQNKIMHIHIKDKDKNGINVKLGTGIANLSAFFEHPVIQSYSGFFTLETSRENDSYKTASYNLEYIKAIMQSNTNE